jgi:predicted nucleic acid-binding protein
MIAATAVENDLTLVSRNLEDYEDIPGLKLYQSK